MSKSFRRAKSASRRIRQPRWHEYSSGLRQESRRAGSVRVKSRFTFRARGVRFQRGGDGRNSRPVGTESSRLLLHEPATSPSLRSRSVDFGTALFHRPLAGVLSESFRICRSAAARNGLLLAGDWPEFRGPTGQGVAAEAKVPTHWSDSENVAWKVEVPGLAWSSPTIVRKPDLPHHCGRDPR